MNRTKGGMDYRLELPNTSLGRDVAELAERGILRANSFAFRVLPDGVRYNDDVTERTLTAIRVFEFSAVTNPAYPDSVIDGLKRDFDAAKPAPEPEPVVEPEPAYDADNDQAYQARQRAVAVALRLQEFDDAH